MNDANGKTVVFHAGTYKTGTTFLQKTFIENSSALRASGLDYIEFAPRTNLGRYTNADFILDEDFDKSYVIDKIKRSPEDKILISEEDLVERVDVITNDAFRDFKKVVIIYIRPPVEFIASWAGEFARPYNYYVTRPKGRAETIGMMAVKDSLPILARKYATVLTGFFDALAEFPDIELIIRPYDRTKFINGNILEDFFGSIGIDTNNLRSLIDESKKLRINEAIDRRFYDVSTETARLLTLCGAAPLYSDEIVRLIYRHTRSGDPRRISDTLTDAQIFDIYGELSPVYERLSTPPFCFEGFAQMLPSICGTERPAYEPLDEMELKGFISQLIAQYILKAKEQQI